MVAKAPDGQVALDLARAHRPDVVLLDVRMPEINGLSVCREVREFLPEAVIFMISALGDEEFVREATAAGARDYITKPFRIEDLMERVRSELSLQHSRSRALSSPPSQGKKRSKVWAFWSPRSGAGCTTLAINAALEVVRVNQTTLFVDLDLVFCDSEQLLGLTQMVDLGALVDASGHVAVEAARSRVEVHPSGLHCLYQHDPVSAGRFQPAHVRELVQGLGASYERVILDLPSGIGSLTGAALEAADTVWMVAGPDPLAARNITKALGLFHRLGYPRSKFHLLLNRVDRKSEPLLRELLPDIPEAVFPEEPAAFHQAVRTAYPAVLSHPSCGFSRALKQLVAKSLALTTAEAEVQRSWTERFMGLLGRS